MKRRHKIMSMDNYLEVRGDIVPQPGKDMNVKLVTTNGAFDILHAGHVDSLQKASEFGNRLIVLVNTDASVKRYKGKSKPYVSLDNRMMVLSAIEYVDYVIPFDEDTPMESLERLYLAGLGPHVHVKGGDYKELPETELINSYGGEVELIPFAIDISTTKIVEKIISSRLSEVYNV